jgi:hypothetical protein
MIKKLAFFLSILFTNVFAGWSDPIRISNPGGCSYPFQIMVGDTLSVSYVAYNNGTKIIYQRSTDGGLTWISRRVLSDDSCETLFPRMIASGQRLMVLWKNHFYQSSSNNIGYSISSNGGRNWAVPRYVLNPNWPENNYFAVSNGPGLNINITAFTTVDDSLVFYSIRTTDFGQSWSQPTAMFRTLESAQINQISIGDTVHVVWDGRFDINRAWEIRYLRSTDNGLTWSNNQLLSSNDWVRSVLPAICLNQYGAIHVVWMDGKYSSHIDTGDILDRYTTDGGMTWSPENQATFTNFAWDAEVASSGDTIHIAWNDEGTGLAHRSIYYTKSTDNGLNWSEPYWLDGTLDDSAEPNLITVDGIVFCVWTDGRANPDTNINGGLYLSEWNPEPDRIDEREISKPAKLALAAYPNPFNSSIRIDFSNFRGEGKIKLFDVQGRLITTFEIKGGEYGKIIWDATDAMGNKVSSGIYFAKASAGNNSTTMKMILLK